MVVQGKSLRCSSWYLEQAAPTEARSLVTVPLAAPVNRQVARIELPSTKALIIWVRFSRLNLFNTPILYQTAQALSSVLGLIWDNF